MRKMIFVILATALLGCEPADETVGGEEECPIEKTSWWGMTYALCSSGRMDEQECNYITGDKPDHCQDGCWPSELADPCFDALDIEDGDTSACDFLGECLPWN